MSCGSNPSPCSCLIASVLSMNRYEMLCLECPRFVLVTDEVAA